MGLSFWVAVRCGQTWVEFPDCRVGWPGYVTELLK